MPVNRWLPPNSGMNSAMGSGRAFKIMAGLIAALLGLLVAATAAIFEGREPLGHFLLAPEEVEIQRSINREHDAELQESEVRLLELETRIRLLEAQLTADREAAAQQQQQRLEAQQRARDAAQRDQIDRLIREQQRLLEALRSQASPSRLTSDELRLDVSRMPARAYRVAVNRQLNERERRHYRAQFARGCGAAAIVLDAGSGFVVFSESCADWTFAGPEFVVEVSSRE
jgi:hypothetical protein